MLTDDIGDIPGRAGRLARIEAPCTARSSSATPSIARPAVPGSWPSRATSRPASRIPRPA